MHPDALSGCFVAPKSRDARCGSTSDLVTLKQNFMNTRHGHMLNGITFLANQSTKLAKIFAKHCTCHIRACFVLLRRNLFTQTFLNFIFRTHFFLRRWSCLLCLLVRMIYFLCVPCLCILIAIFPNFRCKQPHICAVYCIWYQNSFKGWDSHFCSLAHVIDMWQDK